MRIEEKLLNLLNNPDYVQFGGGFVCCIIKFRRRILLERLRW